MPGSRMLSKVRLTGKGGVPAAVDIDVQPVGAEASLALCTLYHGPCAGIDGVAATRRSADHPGLPRPMLVSIAVPYAEPAADRRRSSWASSRRGATTSREGSACGDSLRLLVRGQYVAASRSAYGTAMDTSVGRTAARA